MALLWPKWAPPLVSILQGAEWSGSRGSDKLLHWQQQQQQQWANYDKWLQVVVVSLTEPETEQLGRRLGRQGHDHTGAGLDLGQKLASALAEQSLLVPDATTTKTKVFQLKTLNSHKHFAINSNCKRMRNNITLNETRKRVGR